MLVIKSKRTDYNTQINLIEKKITTDHDHDKYITTQEFNKLKSEDISVRLSQANLATKNDIAHFVKKKMNFVENELNELSEKVIAISTKGLTTDLINKFCILNGAKDFFSEIFQNYTVFIPSKK